MATRRAAWTVQDVAAYILELTGRISTMKLQKLAYYAQAWSLVWDERPLFRARIEAWANGPVVPQLYRLHRGEFDTGRWSAGDPSRLDATARATVKAVVEYYAHKPAQWLSDLTHMEAPWSDARRGLAPGERSKREITPATLAEYYGSL